MKSEIRFELKHPPLARIGQGSFLLLVLFSMSSCYSYGPVLQPGQPVPLDWQKQSQYFIPTAFNAPMLDSAELAALSLNILDISTDIDMGIDAAVRLTPKWAVTGNLGSHNMGHSYKTETSQYEFGAGYTGTVFKDLKWEAFTGFGNMRYHLKFFEGYAKINTNFYYVQPAIYYHQPGKKLHFTFGVATRLALQRPDVTERNIGASNPQPFTEKQLSILESSNTLWALEPGLVLRFGWNPVQLTAQYFGIIYLNESALHGQKSMFNIGLRFVLPRPSNRE
jgi:hypothetical protein